MKTTRRTKIRFEKHEVKFVRFGGAAHCFCQNCLTETGHYPIAQTAMLLGVSEKTVFRLAETGRIHSTETAEGRLLICADSAAKLEK